jgi:hypothetical protein
MASTIGSVVAGARTLLQDKRPLPAVRYSDDEMFEAFNDAMAEARAKRPDLFLALGLRTALPRYTAADLATAFPLDEAYASAFTYFLVGRAELREDPFAQDGRAVVLMNKFVSQLLSVQS